MKSLIIILSIIIFFLFNKNVQSQLVTSVPAMPTVTDLVVIKFNASNTPLKGYSGELYAHAGVLTNQSSNDGDWKHVKTDWGKNTEETKLNRIETDIYEFTVSPDVLTYYGITSNEKVVKLAFVFRSSDAKTQTANIYVDIFESGLNVSIKQPASNSIYNLSEEINIDVKSANADKTYLYYDGNEIASSSKSDIIAKVKSDKYGFHWIKVKASNEDKIIFDSVSLFIKQPVVIESLSNALRDGINYIDDSSVVLVLFAPNKNFVYVMGDFNNWLISDDFQMKKTPDGKRFWIKLSTLTPDKEYIYQYFIDGKIKIADPYTDKISDPSNDKYILSTTYPGLIKYPEGKTTEIASVLQTNQKAYHWQVEKFNSPSQNNLIIYELLVRDFSLEKSYMGVISKLDYLKKLGIDAIELMPVNEFEGNISWGYNPSFYFAPDKAYGTKNDLKQLIDECHKKGMVVIIDMVLNHSYGQSPFLRMYFEGGAPTADNPWYNLKSNFTNPSAQWGYDLNHESTDTQMLVDSINSYWMSEYKVDGFRFDFTKGFGNNPKTSSDEWGSIYDADRIRLLKRMKNEIVKRKPDAIVIFEHLAENKEEKELANDGILLWGNLNSKYNEATMGYNESDKSDLTWGYYKSRSWDKSGLVIYMESHDEERLMYKNAQYGNSSGDYTIKNLNTGLKRIELAALFFIPIPGPKMVWQFGELGYDISIDENGRTGEKPILWEYYENPNRKKLYQVFSTLTELKHKYLTFREGTVEMDVKSKLKKIKISHNDMDAVILGNFDVNNGTITASFSKSGEWYEYFTGQNITVDNVDMSIELNAGEYRLYTSKKLEKPDIIGLNISNERKDNFKVYPNPVKEVLQVEGLEDISEIRVIDIYGRILNQSKISGNSNISIKVDNIPSGLYIISILKKRGETIKAKFIKE